MSNMISAEQRELLYKEIWDEAMSKVAKRYSISDVALRKKCLLWGIPIPSREYRGRVAHGQKPYRTPLPELTREMKRYVYGYAITFKNIGSLPDAALYSEEPMYVYSEKTKDLLDSVRTRAIPIPKAVSDFVPSVRDKLSELKKDKKCTNLKQYQRVYGVVHGINDYLYELEGWGNVNMDYAYWHMARSSWKVEYIVENEKIGLRFVEDFYYCPGRIEPKIQFEYKDQDGKPLEKQAGEIIYRLFLESGRALQFKELGVRREKKRKAEEARARKLAPYIEAEDKKAKRALDDAKAYKNAILIREYAETYRERHNQEFSEKPELKDYYLWLLARADWLDPLIENDYDALLEDAVAKE